jgi:hypothetical protein
MITADLYGYEVGVHKMTENKFQLSDPMYLRYDKVISMGG